MSTNPMHVAQALFEQLERAWNKGDGESYAEPFTVDADFVDIRGAHHMARASIAAGHQAIFDTIYQSSTVRYTVTDARTLADECIVAHAHGTLDTPSGPAAGSHDATMTAVIVGGAGADGWGIAAFHNTLVSG